MAERPILFSGEMVRAILDGRKTQTRRPVKAEVAFVAGKDDDRYDPGNWGLADSHGAWVMLDQTRPVYQGDGQHVNGEECRLTCPYGAPGDLLWVRETHAIVPASAYRCSTDVSRRVSPDGEKWAMYRAGWERSAPRWRPSIHMPRWASRITLRVTEVRVERLLSITEDDATNPWVWVVGFEVQS